MNVVTLAAFDTLYTLAEISIGLAGFAAIVVLFKRQDSGHWKASHADYFGGMILHAMTAAFFCLLPTVVAVFTSAESVVWSVSSALSGIQILVQTIIVVRLPTTTLQDGLAADDL